MKILFALILIFNFLFGSTIPPQINLTIEEKSWLSKNPKIILGVIAN